MSVKNAMRRLKKGKFNRHSWALANTRQALMRHKWFHEAESNAGRCHCEVCRFWS